VLHVGQINVEAKLTAMQSQIDALTALLTDLGGRMTAAEQLNGSPPSPLVAAVNAHTTTLSGYGTRLSDAENLSGVASTLTNTVKQVRDLTTGTPLYTAVNNMRTMVAGTALTNAVIGMRDMSVSTSTLVSTLIAVRDFTSGTPLYTTVTGYNTRLTAVETLSGTPTSTLYTTVTGYGTRLSAAENLNGIATTLTDTVKQVRDLTSGTPLYTAVNNMRTLVAGTALTNAVNAHETRLDAAEGLNGVATVLTNTVKQVRDLTTGTALYTAVNNMRSLVVGTTLTDTVIALRDKTGTSAMVATVKSLTAGAACCGTTTPGSTSWIAYGTSGAVNFVDVSIASCGFTAVPSVLTSLTGFAQHFMTIGQTSLFSTTATSFRVYVTAVTQISGAINSNPKTPGEYNALDWAIAWCAFA
jgi:hypothetical protein